MSRTMIKTSVVINSSNMAKSVAGTAATVAEGIGSVSGSTDSQIKSRYGISGRLSGVQSDVNQIASKVTAICRAVENGASQYQAVDDRLVNLIRTIDKVKKASVNTGKQNPYSVYFDDDSTNKKLSGELGKVEKTGNVGDTSAGASVEHVDGKAIAAASAAASVANGSMEVEALYGFYKEKGEGSVLGAEASAKAGYDASENNLEAYAKAEASAYALKGEYKQERFWGLDKFSAEGDVLAAGASATAYASLIHNGLMVPGIGAEAEASAAVAKGEVEETLGLDRYNAKVGAEGYVVGAEASAEAKIGAIQDEGEVSYGVSAKAEAGAYLAKGEVKGGFTLFGIEVDGSLGGSVGVGVEAGGAVTSDSINISAGVSALLGVDVEVEIDWSNFGF